MKITNDQIITQRKHSAKQWLARMLQTRLVRYTMLVLMVFLGLLFILKGGYTLWYWNENVARMEEQLIPTGWAKGVAMANMVLLLTIGLGLAIGVRFSRFRSSTLAAASLLLFVYAAYARVVQIKQLVAVAPCSCIGWWDGMTWSSVLRTNIVLLVIATAVWFGYTYSEERRSVGI